MESNMFHIYKPIGLNSLYQFMAPRRRTQESSMLVFEERSSMNHQDQEDVYVPNKI